MFLTSIRLMNKEKKILFVCRANICRSPMAEAIFKVKLEEANLSSKVAVASRAIEDWCVNQPPHPQVLTILKHFHIPTKGLKSQQLHPRDGKLFDLIACMDEAVYQDARERLGEKADKCCLFNSFLGSKNDVLDPMYTKDFLTTYDEISEGINAIIAILKKEMDQNDS